MNVYKKAESSLFVEGTVEACLHTIFWHGCLRTLYRSEGELEDYWSLDELEHVTFPWSWQACDFGDKIGAYEYSGALPSEVWG